MSLIDFRRKIKILRFKWGHACNFSYKMKTTEILQTNLGLKIINF